MSIRFLHTNDLHGKLDEAVSAQLQELRKDVDFYFDSGDAIQSGNLAMPRTVDPVWAAFALLECTASVIGNRETHPLRKVFEKKIEGHVHPVLCGNLTAKDGSAFLPRTITLEHDGTKIGVVSTMVAMATPRMKTAGAWFGLWSDPIRTVIDLAREIRPTVDLVVALTHIGFSQDRLVAQQSGDIDIIFGGHSHTVLEQPIKENHTWIVQGGSHARFAGVYEWDGETLSGGLKPLRASTE